MLSVSTSSQFAGAVSSIKWGDKEFINNWDHGRQLQLNSQFFNRFICYNPYEAGSFNDGRGPTSTSKLLSMTNTSTSLDATTQMAWYYDKYLESDKPEDYCGDPSQWLPVNKPYTTPLSDYKVRKTVTIGYKGIPNVIEYLVEQAVPEAVREGMNNVTAVVNYEFSSLRSWDVVSKDYRNVRALAGVDDRIKVVSTADGNHAMGWYAPELHQPYADVGVVNWWFIVPPNPFYRDPNDPSKLDLDFACVHFGSVNRYDSFGPGTTHDRAYLVIGNLEQVRQGLALVHSQFTSLDPEVFNWRDYLSMHGLGFLVTPEAAQNHWLSQGIVQPLRGSRTFSPTQYLQMNPDLGLGQSDYLGAIAHYVNTGRDEGRGTTVRPAAGMQHLVTLENGYATASGQNSSAQLGNGDTAPSGPTTVAHGGRLTEVAAGDYASLGVKPDGSVWAWGSNQYGIRGDGGTGGIIAEPVAVPGIQASTPSRVGIHALAVGTACYAVIDPNGQVWTWGSNWNGRLGDGTTADRYLAARVKKSANPNDYLTGVVSIAIGGGIMAAVDADGTVWTWGAGANGALGNGSTEDSSYAVQVLQGGNNNTTTPLVGITQVACGSSGFCIALARYGQVFGWGNNDFSQLGIAPGGALSIATPIAVGPGNIDMIAAGGAHGLARSASDGQVYGWGYNGYGQLGAGFASVAQYPPIPMSAGPDGMNDVVDLAACSNFSVMVRSSDRAVFVAGDDQSGQFGSNGTGSTQYLPIRSR
jgi:alpha-tubulin suppressor-like RCC1 family protein